LARVGATFDSPQCGHRTTLPATENSRGSLASPKPFTPARNASKNRPIMSPLLKVDLQSSPFALRPITVAHRSARIDDHPAINRPPVEVRSLAHQVGSRLVPYRTPCPRCTKVGFVRFETVLARGLTHRDYYCGACHHSWREHGDGEAQALAQGPDHLERSRPPR
jgi:hypothetical protein